LAELKILQGGRVACSCIVKRAVLQVVEMIEDALLKNHGSMTEIA
jgi:hypothetical protein